MNIPQDMTNSSKTIVWDRIQQPFGETYSTTGSATGNLRFPGQFVSDTGTLLYYNLMRDYDPTMGRYIEADPIGLSGSTIASMGLYSYVNGNPIRWVDSVGLQAIPPLFLGTCLQRLSLLKHYHQKINALLNRDQLLISSHQQIRRNFLLKIYHQDGELERCRLLSNIHLDIGNLKNH